MLLRGIDRRRDGTFRVRLPRSEREVLAAIPAQLREAIAADDPSLFRLFPQAFADDDEANEEYARLVGSGLVEGKVLALAELERTAFAEQLTEDELRSWLGGLESLRLVLGTQLGVTEETYAGFDEHDPDAPRVALFHWLTWLQEEAIQALSAALD